MKKVRTEDSVGMTLCHDMTAIMDGKKGRLFARGHVVRECDVEQLLRIGKQHIFIWEEHAGEVHEEDAALRLSAKAAGKGIICSAPSEGKITLSAIQRGYLRVDRQRLRQVNGVQDVTIATLPDRFPVEVGTAVAGARIVPLVTKEERLEQAEAIMDTPILQILPYEPKTVGLIITGSEVYHGRIQDGFAPVLREKMEYYGCPVIDIAFCDDDTEMIAETARNQLEMGAKLLLFTGGMSVDPDDVTPTAIASLGASVVSHGMPAQPGNMLMLAYLGDIPLIGVPGVAFHKKYTFLDILLPRILTGEILNKEDIIAYGEGGLCMNCPVCRFPACTFGRA